MEVAKAMDFIEGLTIGYNKKTGERLFDKEENPEVVESLKKSLEILKKEKRKIDKKNNLPARAKERWTDREENELLNIFNKYKEKLDFAKLVEKLAKRHQRTEGSIRSKINKLV